MILMSQLNHRHPNAEELVDLDTFDLAFLVMTGNVRLDKATTILEDVVKANKDLIAFGPQSRLLERVINAAWKKYAKQLEKDIRSAFTVEQEKVVVDKKKLSKALKKNKNIGKKVSKAVAPKSKAVFTETVAKATTYFKKQRAKAQKRLDPDAFDALMVSQSNEQLLGFIESYPSRTLAPEVNRMATLAVGSENLRKTDLLRLKEQVRGVAKFTRNYNNQLSDVQVGRAWHYTGLQMATTSGVTQGQIIAHLDRRTCPVCVRMHGRVVDVAPSVKRMEKILEETDPDKVSAQAKFPRVPEIDNKSPKALRAQGYVPPFHGRCRCDIAWLWVEET